MHIAYTRKTLPNGLRVLLAPMTSTGTVTVMITTGVGSRHEEQKNRGVAHFLEHMMFKGTKKRPQPKMIAEELDGIGGQYNAYTSMETTAYYAKVPSQWASVALDVVSDIFLHSTLPEEELERERGPILQEHDMYRDQPDSLVGIVYDELLYGDTPLGWDTVGTKETIKSLSRDDLINFRSAHYTGVNTAICVAGAFDEKMVLAMITDIFSTVPMGTKNIHTLQKNIWYGAGKQRHVHKDVDQVNLLLGAPGYDRFHVDKYALSLLQTIMSGGMSSRLFSEVREKRGLAYSVGMFARSYAETGDIGVHAGVAPEKVEETLEVIRTELTKIATVDVPETELAKAKNQAIGVLLMGLESSSSVARFLLDQEILRDEILQPEEIIKNLSAVTTADIRRVATDLFSDSARYCLVTVGPKE